MFILDSNFINYNTISNLSLIPTPNIFVLSVGALLKFAKRRHFKETI